jgi:peroxiredoxin
VLQAGDPIPDVRVWISTQEGVSLRDLSREKPLLLLFYLFDWSST